MTPRTAPGGSAAIGTREPHQWIALAVGVAYILVGILGFIVTGFDHPLEHDHSQTLLGFAINPLHNVVHLIIGGLGVWLWRTASSARTYGWILAIGYGATFVYGLIVANDPDLNILNINGADNGLHLASALIGLFIALWPRARRTTTTTA